MLELWNLMDAPIEEQQKYQHITCTIAASEHEITQANSLSEDFIKYVEAEHSLWLMIKVAEEKTMGASSLFPSVDLVDLFNEFISGGRIFGKIASLSVQFITAIAGDSTTKT
ncbi:unnamed protein product [Brassica rapa]|uniref:Uncharacterized protein n=1 Tax=Brassica campestris TaxID=3711 RepID=A0A8D9GJ03_BRACM|nr:unnamed protein product [Brassica rapa]